jgi:hypothetical protein
VHPGQPVERPAGRLRPRHPSPDRLAHGWHANGEAPGDPGGFAYPWGGTA